MEKTFCTCRINGKYTFPFQHIAEMVEHNENSANMRLSLRYPSLTFEEAEKIKTELDNDFLNMAGVENAVTSIECFNPEGKTVFLSTSYTYIAGIELNYNVVGNWQLLVTFLLHKNN